MKAHHRPRFRALGWLAVAAMLALAILGPTAGTTLALSGAVYTSNFDGSVIDQNIYGAKADVYLTGGPCNGGSHLEDGDYYFEVLQQAGGGQLLSTDAIGERGFTVTSGFISATTGNHATHPVNCDPPQTGVTIQLLPFGDSANGEYKLEVATKDTVEECEDFDPESTTFAFCQGADQKSDDFKVGAEATPTPTATATATPTPTVAPTATPTGEVQGATGTPRVTLPPTDAAASTGSPSSGTWRLLLVGLAGVLATILLLVPSPRRGQR